MPAQSYTVGPGSLVLGATGTSLEISCQITSATVEWDVDAEDDTDLLCGEVLPGEETFTAAISGNMLQDLSDDGIVEWSWTNRGTVQPLVYIPNTAEGKQITGSIKVRPLAVGGDAKTRAASDFEWPFVGEPDLEPVTP